MPPPTSLRLLPTLHWGKHPSRPFSAQTRGTRRHSQCFLFNKVGLLPCVFYNFCKKAHHEDRFPRGGTPGLASWAVPASPSSPRWQTTLALPTDGHRSRSWHFAGVFNSRTSLRPGSSAHRLAIFFFLGQEIFFFCPPTICQAPGQVLQVSVRQTPRAELHEGRVYVKLSEIQPNPPSRSCRPRAPPTASEVVHLPPPRPTPTADPNTGH